MLLFNILCIDDDPSFLLATKSVLKKKYMVTTALSFEEGLKILETQLIDLLFLDVKLGKENGIDLLYKIKELHPNLDVVMLSGERDPQLIVNAIRDGASDYICKPCPSEDLLAVVEKQLKNREIKDRYEALIEDMNECQSLKGFIGKSKSLTDVLDSAKRLKGYNASVLIEGESGTGKELLARHLHGLEEDVRRPFIAVNCAAIPDNLLESELFGYEQGAFTGASKKKVGKFELANGGDIFLDEINSLRPELQAKLLRALQEKEFYRLGGTQSIQVKFRVIAATNVDLQEEVRNNHFRQDLLYRLRVVSLTMPPLRKRQEDIDELVAFFIKKHSRADQKKLVSPAVLEFFKQYKWPGNIRELENVLQSLIIMAVGDKIVLADLPQWMTATEQKSVLDPNSYEAVPELKFSKIDQSLKNVMQKMEQEYIKKVIENTGGNVTEAARLLGVSRSKVYYTLRDEETL
ncbi:MAG: hypothetical protein ACD_62C00238G0003 [uncultured bacterium]|nr:MAG: hypothetical protein ACD_62C00238G0003 [uncultured bacterium]HLD45661.1 sigma-54 dependent transcriptional regulator [bacterium]